MIFPEKGKVEKGVHAEIQILKSFNFIES